jgi:hypothetical protein
MNEVMFCPHNVVVWVHPLVFNYFLYINKYSACIPISVIHFNYTCIVWKTMHIGITYVCLQKPGVAEAEFARNDLKYEFNKIFGMRKPAPIILAKGKSFSDSIDSDGSCPVWLSEEDIFYYTDKFEKTGFTGGLNYYRCMDLYASYVMFHVPINFTIFFSVFCSLITSSV